MYAAARKTFQHFPEEVFELWLDDRIRSNGWPPSGPEWHGFLFGHSVEFWQSLRWEHEPVVLRPEELAEKSFRLLKELLKANVHGTQNLVARYIGNTRERFQGILRYLVEHRDLPAPLILLKIDGEFEVIDGAHRVAVLTFASQQPHFSPAVPAEVSAWVARAA